MVERQLDGLERQGLGQWGPGPNDTDRCFPSGVGSGLQWSANRRSLDTVRKTTPHQLFRVDGRSLCSESLHSTQNSSEGSFADGQCNSSDIYQQDGGHQVTHSVKSCIRTVDLVSSTSHQYYCKAYSRNPNHSGRPGVAYCGRPLRLQTQTRDLSMHSESLGPSRNGSVCIPPVVPDPKVRKLKTRPRGGNSGCLYPRLGSAPPFALVGRCLKQVFLQKVQKLVLVALVWETQPWYPLFLQLWVDFPRLLPQPVDLLTRQGENHPLTHLQLAGWFISTGHIQRQVFLQKLKHCSWLHGGKTPQVSIVQLGKSGLAGVINDRLNPISAVLDFLSREFNSGQAYRSINVYRSTISMTHPTIDSLRVGNHPMVCQLMKGIFNKRPPLPRYTQTWKVNQVTSYLEALSNNSELPLKQLSRKLVVLLALTSAERGSELAAHDLRFRRFYPEGVCFTLPQLTKKSCVGSPAKTSFHASLPSNAKLCPVECLREYEKRTETLRPNASDTVLPKKLFESYIRPHRPVSSSTLARWMKEALAEANVDTAIFKAHSSRGASTTAAAEAGISLPQILTLADWSGPSTFNKFYFRPNFDAQPGRAILESTK